MVVKRLRAALANEGSTANRGFKMPPGFQQGAGYVIVTLNDPGDKRMPGKHYYVRKDTPEDQVLHVALALHMDYQLYVERFQLNAAKVGLSGSGYSREDLVSNRLGFAIYTADPEGKTLKKPEDVAKHFGLGRKLSKEEATELLKWQTNDLGHESIRWYKFTPPDDNDLTTSFKGVKMKFPDFNKKPGLHICQSGGTRPTTSSMSWKSRCTRTTNDDPLSASAGRSYGG
ncbi:MAG: hypothetical protein K2X87_33095 [Gemmataceae bacterium]|nr:hypothetical protein [Gemmataceae bacterium]